MTADWTKEIPTWEKDYLRMNNELSKRQTEILNGSPLKSHEGMVFGRMYSDWKKLKEYD